MEQWEITDSMQNQPVRTWGSVFRITLQITEKWFYFFFLYKDITCLAFSELAKETFVLKLKLTSGIWAEFPSLMQIAEDGVIDTRCPFPAVRLIWS